ncbi:uncharacterized protein LY89DRAFT_719430 [Mollisia scopiformis]|uniref:Uncharacterized protein n=1 Tax=Mollisia scopiformis TaxID=149040 RepID=A0A194X6A7_MOLSC|nr:uncharacterized protein LY89DRAFT_719430 [Mollisia scopiformis]KUJ15708.1 hypothetical protein LY89DRAFT_719430 [Mollisia scopiformis]
MSGNQGETSSKKAWTTEENYTFVLKLLAQVTSDKAPKISDIQMPGRSSRALGHQWAKVKSEMAALGEGAEGPAKAAGKKNKSDDDDEDAPAPKKFRKGTGKKALTEIAEE